MSLLVLVPEGCVWRVYAGRKDGWHRGGLVDFGCVDRGGDVLGWLEGLVPVDGPALEKCGAWISRGWVASPGADEASSGGPHVGPVGCGQGTRAGFRWAAPGG